MPFKVSFERHFLNSILCTKIFHRLIGEIHIISYVVFCYPHRWGRIVSFSTVSPFRIFHRCQDTVGTHGGEVRHRSLVNRVASSDQIISAFCSAHTGDDFKRLFS